MNITEKWEIEVYEENVNTENIKVTYHIQDTLLEAQRLINTYKPKKLHKIVRIDIKKLKVFE